MVTDRKRFYCIDRGKKKGPRYSGVHTCSDSRRSEILQYFLILSLDSLLHYKIQIMYIFSPRNMTARGTRMGIDQRCEQTEIQIV